MAHGILLCGVDPLTTRSHEISDVWKISQNLRESGSRYQNAGHSWNFQERRDVCYSESLYKYFDKLFSFTFYLLLLHCKLVKFHLTWASSVLVPAVEKLSFALGHRSRQRGEAVA